MAEVVFRSTHPDVFAAIENWRTAMADWHTRSKALLVELGFVDRHFVVASGLGSRWITGVEVSPDGTVPAGWRVAHRSGMDVLVPDKRRKAGKDAQARIYACQPPADVRSVFPGMPAEHWVGNRILSPEMRTIDGTVWLRWMCESVPDVDTGVWETAPLSQYWAAREARDAEAVTSDV